MYLSPRSPSSLSLRLKRHSSFLSEKKQEKQQLSRGGGGGDKAQELDVEKDRNDDGINRKDHYFQVDTYKPQFPFTMMVRSHFIKICIIIIIVIFSIVTGYR